MAMRPCSTEVRSGRMLKAEGFLQAAADIDLLDEAGELRDAVVTLHVHAGIAAADVISCVRLGEHSTGENHADAVAVLQRANPSSAKHLRTLLGVKTKAGYSHASASAVEAKKAARAANQLVEDARRVAASTAGP